MKVSPTHLPSFPRLIPLGDFSLPVACDCMVLSKNYACIYCTKVASILPELFTSDK